MKTINNIYGIVLWETDFYCNVVIFVLLFTWSATKNQVSVGLPSWSYSRDKVLSSPSLISGPRDLKFSVWLQITEPLKYNSCSWYHLRNQWEIPGTLLSPGNKYGPIPVSLGGLIKIHSRLRTWQRDMRGRSHSWLQMGKFPSCGPDWLNMVPQSTA